MLYYLFKYLAEFDFPGARLFQYLSFRAALAVILSLLISAVFGKKLIQRLRRLQVGETIRDLGLEGQMEKTGTPTMGGLIILGAILIPVLLFARLDNVYVVLMLSTTVWLGFIGFLDDYIKVFKKNKEGLAGRFKIVGQVGLGILVGTVLYFHPDVTMRRKIVDAPPVTTMTTATNPLQAIDDNYVDVNTQVTTIPFVKNHEFNYSKLLAFLGNNYEKFGWLIFIPVCILIITSVSNGANITDGIDGLATGTSAIIGVVLGIFAYVSGNSIFANYLNVMYIPNSGELVVFTAAFVGACIGFLWYNAYPAQVFMGDTGSLAIGGIIATLAICIRKELLIPILCGIFLVENLSVVMQVSYFKYTKKKYGEGRRILKMSPLHHHYQKLGMNESKIVSRFWIVGIGLAIFTLITLKLR
jgi:phospho-N-acetylmuramoyl-pentapeptide-transferase